MNNVEITDEEALETFRAGRTQRAQVGTVFCTHTVVYPVWVERKKGVPEKEIRHFVTLGQFYSKRKMEKATDVEKRYAKLNKDYNEAVKAKGRINFRKDPGNILNATPIDMKK